MAEGSDTGADAAPRPTSDHNGEVGQEEEKGGKGTPAGGLGKFIPDPPKGSPPLQKGSPAGEPLL